MNSHSWECPCRECANQQLRDMIAEYNQVRQAPQMARISAETWFEFRTRDIADIAAINQRIKASNTEILRIATQSEEITCQVCGKPATCIKMEGAAIALIACDKHANTTTPETKGANA